MAASVDFRKKQTINKVWSLLLPNRPGNVSLLQKIKTAAKQNKNPLSQLMQTLSLRKQQLYYYDAQIAVSRIDRYALYQAVRGRGDLADRAAISSHKGFLYVYTAKN